MRICACGCGGEVASSDKRTTYIPNHHLAKARAARSVNQKAISRSCLANPTGLCECGCGELAPLAYVTRRSAGWVEGQPVRFLSGHNSTGMKRGPGRYIQSRSGYVMLRMPTHPDGAKYKGYVLEHRYVMEQHIGRPLGPREHVHHLDHDRTNNAIENLLIVDPIEHAKYHTSQPRRTQTAEHRAKLSTSQKLAWAKRRAK